MPCCYFLRGCWKTCFRPLFCNNCWKREKLQCLGHKCFSEKLRCCWHMLAKFIGESLVPYFTCHTATFEGDVEKHVFSQFCNNCWKREKLQCLGHKCFFLKSCDVADKCWQKIGESLVPYFTCHTATFEGDVEKHVFPSVATTAERKKMLWHSYSVTPFCNNCWKEKMLWHSYSVTPILQQLLKRKNVVTLLQRHSHWIEWPWLVLQAHNCIFSRNHIFSGCHGHSIQIPPSHPQKFDKREEWV